MIRRIKTSAQIMITIISFMGCYYSGNSTESVLAVKYRFMINRFDTRKTDQRIDIKYLKGDQY